MKQHGGGMRRIAVDTNILARLLADTASPEGRFAEELLVTSRIYVSRTVLLETEWLLRSVMRFDREDVNRAIASLLTLDRIEVEDPEVVAVAVNAHASGMDFADALHVLSAADTDGFITFDRDLVRLANRYIDGISVELAQ